MARENKVLFDNTPTGTTEVTVGTVPTGKVWEIHAFQVNNIHASGAANMTLKLNDVTKYNAVEIENKKHVTIPYRYILTAGQTVKFTTSVASTLNIDAIGVEYDA